MDRKKRNHYVRADGKVDHRKSVAPLKNIKVSLPSFDERNQPKVKKKQIKQFSKQIIYKTITLTNEDIKAMKSFQTENVEFTGAIDYDGHHKRFSELYVERGFETNAFLLKKYYDPDYEVLFHTHPLKSFPHPTTGPSPADITNMIIRFLANDILRNQSFVIDQDYVYSYKVNDEEIFKEFINDVIETVDEFNVLKGTINEFDYVLKEIIRDDLFELQQKLIPNPKDEKLMRALNRFDKIKWEDKLNKRDINAMGTISERYKIQEALIYDQFEKRTGVKVVNHGKNPKEIETEIPIFHDPLRDDRINPRYRVSKI